MAQLKNFELKFYLIICFIFILAFKLSSSTETTFVFSQTDQVILTIAYNVEIVTPSNNVLPCKCFSVSVILYNA